MSDSDQLTVKLSLCTIAVAFVCVGVSQAGWKNKWFVGCIFLIATLLVVAAFSWTKIASTIPNTDLLIIIQSKWLSFDSGIILGSGLITLIILLKSVISTYILRASLRQRQKMHKKFNSEVRAFILVALNDTVNEFCGIFSGIFNCFMQADDQSLATKSIMTRYITEGIYAQYESLRISIVDQTYELDLENTQIKIRDLLLRYQLDQKYIVIFADSARLKLKSIVWIPKWLKADESALNSFRALKSLNEAGVLRSVSEGVFGSTRPEIFSLEKRTGPPSDEKMAIPRTSSEYLFSPFNPQVEVIDILFDQHPTEMYINVSLFNPGEQTVIFDWKLYIDVPPQSYAYLFRPRFIKSNKKIPMSNPPDWDDFSQNPLRSGERSILRLGFSIFEGPVIDRFGVVGANFHLSARDARGTRFFTEYTLREISRS